MRRPIALLPFLLLAAVLGCQAPVVHGVVQPVERLERDGRPEQQLAALYSRYGVPLLAIGRTVYVASCARPEFGALLAPEAGRRRPDYTCVLLPGGGFRLLGVGGALVRVFDGSELLVVRHGVVKVRPDPFPEAGNTPVPDGYDPLITHLVGLLGKVEREVRAGGAVEPLLNRFERNLAALPGLAKEDVTGPVLRRMAEATGRLGDIQSRLKTAAEAREGERLVRLTREMEGPIRTLRRFNRLTGGRNGGGEIVSTSYLREVDRLSRIRDRILDGARTEGYAGVREQARKLTIVLPRILELGEAAIVDPTLYAVREEIRRLREGLDKLERTLDSDAEEDDDVRLLNDLLRPLNLLREIGETVQRALD